MIQRIQSIFLLLASASFWGLFGLPFAKSDAQMEGLFEDQVYNLSDNVGLLIICILGGILALISIFMFKNRKLQLKLNMGTILLSIALIALIIVFMVMDSSSEIFKNVNEGLGLGLPVFAIIFALFANRYIKKDEKLVKSMDRLR